MFLNRRSNTARSWLRALSAGLASSPKSFPFAICGRQHSQGLTRDGSRKEKFMLVLKFLLTILGFGLFASAAILVACDVLAAARLRCLLRHDMAEVALAASHDHRPTTPWVARAATLEERP
jgi:hypothetical protein